MEDSVNQEIVEKDIGQVAIDRQVKPVEVFMDDKIAITQRVFQLGQFFFDQRDHVDGIGAGELLVLDLGQQQQRLIKLAKAADGIVHCLNGPVMRQSQFVVLDEQVQP